MNIEEIQPEIYKRFVHVLENNKLSHAYLFSGGFGSFEMSIWLSQAIFCENKIAALPCGTCRTCRLIEEQDFTDLHIVEPEGQIIKTDQIRALQSTFNQSGFESTKQIVIINGAEKMHLNAANALLKSIEEPESDIYIFLLTENENLVLDTIKSRSQIYTFPRQDKYIKEALIKDGVLTTEADLISKIANSVEEARRLAEDTWFGEISKQLKKYSTLALDNPMEAFLYIDNFLGKFKEKSQQKVAFLLLEVAFSSNLPSQSATKLLERTFMAEKMWKSNVNFQSCLEYIVLDSVVKK